MLSLELLPDHPLSGMTRASKVDPAGFHVAQRCV